MTTISAQRRKYNFDLVKAVAITYLQNNPFVTSNEVINIMKKEKIISKNDGLSKKAVSHILLKAYRGTCKVFRKSGYKPNGDIVWELNDNKWSK